MMRLIDADALKDTIEEIDWYHVSSQGVLVHGANSALHTPLYKADDIYNALDAAPTIEAEPVKRGRWVFEFELGGSNFYRCSECNRQETLLAKESITEWCPYCHCGAKMEVDNG